jgi:hypothetical protein
MSIKSNTYNVVNFLDISIILENSIKIKTDIYYKETNTHDYLNYNSHHPYHIKNNIPFNLAKRIVVFTSDYKKETQRLAELKTWLKECEYPDNIIEKAFHNAKLQGPAPRNQSKEIFPLVTTFYSNLNCQPFITETNLLLNLSLNERVKEVFSNTQPVIAFKQPPNLLRILTSSKIQLINKEIGLFKCTDSRCKICKFYLQEGKTFTTSNGTIWNIKSHITCNSKNVIYYLKCLSCNRKTTYTGKTNNLRLRTNGHISSCRTGQSTDRFDNHVYNCQRAHNSIIEPFFELFVFLELKNENNLISYEKHLHKQKHDTFN